MSLKDPQAPDETNEFQSPGDDRRAVIEAAFEAAEEAPEQKQLALPGVEETEIKPAVPAEGSTAEPETKAVEAKPAAEEGKPAADLPTDRAPQSWKPAEKAKWAQLDPDIRKEVLRRENEITRTLGETAQARQFAQQFQQTVQPYMARIQSIGAHPVAVVGELLKADHLLSTAPKGQRAQFMAQLIKDYDVDIMALDAALSGAPAADPVDSRVEQLLQQRLAPLNTFIQQQQEQLKQQQEESAKTLQQEVEAMAKDEAYPYFEQLREEMADIIEYYATRKNIHLGLKEAYNKAVMSDPVLSKQIQAQTTAATQTVQAQRAKQASVSVRGAPRAQMSGSPAATDRRAIIAAAFEQHAGR